MLIKQPGSVVSKKKLLSRVWPGTFVKESVLAQNIATLRKALDTVNEGSSYIETIPKRGYRFTAEVTLVTDSENQSPAASHATNRSLLTASQPVTNTQQVGRDIKPSNEIESTSWALPSFERRKRVATLPTPPQRQFLRSRATRLTIMGVLVAALLGADFRATERSSSDSSRLQQKAALLVVMPTGNYTPDPNNNYLSAGVTEQLVANLGELSPHHLKIMSYPDRSKWQHGPETREEIRKQLGTDYILFSDLIAVDDVTQVRSQLVDPTNNVTLWSSEYHPRASEIRVTSREVAVAIAKDSGCYVNDIPERKVSGEAHKEQAFREYLQGRYYFNMSSHDGLIQAVSYSQRASNPDLSYAAASAGLAHSNNLLVFYGWSPYRKGVTKAWLRRRPLSNLIRTLRKAMPPWLMPSSSGNTIGTAPRRIFRKRYVWIRSLCRRVIATDCIL